MVKKKTIRMKRAHAAAWLAALRSGEYKQGVGQLVNRTSPASPTTDSYCCLGVMEQVISGSVENTALPSPEWRARHGVEFVGRQQLDHGDNIWLCSAPWIATEECVLSTLNDSRKYDFKQLADIIEQNIEFTD